MAMFTQRQVLLVRTDSHRNLKTADGCDRSGNSSVQVENFSAQLIWKCSVYHNFTYVREQSSKRQPTEIEIETS